MSRKVTMVGGYSEPVCSQYYEGSCYFKVFLPGKPLLSAGDAAELCARHDGHLAIIEGEAENTIVGDLGDSEEAWIGATRDPDDTENFIWLNGSSMTFDSWRQGEPNNRIGDEDCVENNYVRSGLWNDTPCQRDRHVRVGVCEKPVTFNSGLHQPVVSTSSSKVT